MKNIFVALILFIVALQVHAQEIDSDLLAIKNKLDKIVSAEADATTTLDVSFINMPIKHATLLYQKDKPIKFTSDDFIFIPKRGLDFTWSELFRHDFFTVDRGTKNIDNREIKVINAIPLSDKADFAIMTLYLDTDLEQISQAEITTKNEGSYVIKMDYSGDALPNKATIEFEVEKIKMPLNFMGKDTKIDRETLKNDEVKKGMIFLDLVWNNIKMID